MKPKLRWWRKNCLVTPVGRNEGRSSNVRNGSLYAPHSSSNRPRKGGTSRQENCLTSSHARGTSISGMGSPLRVFEANSAGRPFCRPPLFLNYYRHRAVFYRPSADGRFDGRPGENARRSARTNWIAPSGRRKDADHKSGGPCCPASARAASPACRMRSRASTSKSSRSYPATSPPTEAIRLAGNSVRRSPNACPPCAYKCISTGTFAFLSAA